MTVAAPRFDAWPHDPTEIIREALREYVGDGDGEDEKVLAAHDARVRGEALRAAAFPGGDRCPDDRHSGSADPPSTARPED